MDLPPGSFALFLILLFWIGLMVLGVFLMVFPHTGEHRKGKIKPDENASYKT